MTSKTVRIGGASGFWGDSAIATPQLLAVPGLQYLVYDYLAETTMAILARARAKDPKLGYATDFVSAAMAPHLKDILAKGVRVIANAGGLNPQACRDALLEVARAQGLEPRIAVVSGDDVLESFEGWRAAGLKDMHTGDAPPAQLMSANAYVGAQGIARALDLGADIVIAGRCVDSAVVVGALAHEFGWQWDDWNRLAAGTLAGHVIECGAQATGGLFTDWAQVPDWANIGYPVIDCSDDGSFVLSKPAGTGGLIHPGAVSEQVLYEVGDPANYLMPDVTCDFRGVQVVAIDGEQVRVSGARGRAPTPHYKANGTWRNGFQINLMMAIRGINAPAKARKTAEALLERTRRHDARARHGRLSRDGGRAARLRSALRRAFARAAHPRGSAAHRGAARRPEGIGLPAARMRLGRHLDGAGHALVLLGARGHPAGGRGVLLPRGQGGGADAGRVRRPRR